MNEIVNKCFKFNIDTISLLPENLSGVYVIHCIKHKSYIGQTWDLRYRLKTHYNQLLLQRSSNRILQNAWNSYSQDDFEFEILEIIKDTTKKKLYKAENYWLELYKNESRTLFNIYDGIKNQLNIKKIQIWLTEEDYQVLISYASKLERTPANLVKHWVLTAMIGKGLIKHKTLEDLKSEKS